MLLNLDLIYSTNMWETWKLDCFVLFLSVRDADCVLKMMIIYAKSALPSLSSTFPHEKVTVRLPVGSRGAGAGLGGHGALLWRGGDWNSCLMAILLINRCWWVFKNSVSKWRSRRLSLFWWGLGLVVLKKKITSELGCIFSCWHFLLVFRILHSNMWDHGVKETQRP